MHVARRVYLSNRIVGSVLDVGLAKSTWRDKFPTAYDELLKLREDLMADVEAVLKRETRG